MIQVIEHDKLYREATSRWGVASQLLKAAEEASELSAACSRCLAEASDVRIRHLQEEIADVEIMCAQLRCVFGNEGVDEQKRGKLERLRRLLQLQVEEEEESDGDSGASVE